MHTRCERLVGREFALAMGPDAVHNPWHMQNSAFSRRMTCRGSGWLILFVLLSALPVRSAAPATNAPAESRLANRYLLVVETSRAMAPRLPGVLQAVQDLLQKRLGGELRPGDSLGVWTFNDNLYAGRFPLRTWTEGAGQETTAAVVNFLKEQKYEKKAAIEKCIPALQRVSEASRFLTVVLLSSGEPVSGTAWDAAINARLDQWRKEQQRAKMPFVVVLRSEVGGLTGFAVTPVPWEIQLPPFPEALTAARLAASKPASSPAPVEKAAPPIAKPLIVSGKKPAPAPAPAPAASSQAATVVTQAPPAPKLTLVESAAPVTLTTPNPPAALATADSPPRPVEPAPPAPEAKPLQPATAKPVPAGVAPGPKPVTEANAAAPSPSHAGLGLVWVVVGALLIVLFVVVWIWRSRTRPPGPGSLITQSTDRSKE